jgi:hypothetical protein
VNNNLNCHLANQRRETVEDHVQEMLDVPTKLRSLTAAQICVVAEGKLHRCGGLLAVGKDGKC